MSDYKCFTVRIRRDIGLEVKPESEQLDGNTYRFFYGWPMEAGDPYPGEDAWIFHHADWPPSAPAWIASGDLEEVMTASSKEI